VRAAEPPVTCLDLGPADAVHTEGWDRRTALTGPEAKTLKEKINEIWIYPPTDDAEQLLAQAGRFSNG
jgi:NADH dehydrogenase